MQGADGNSPGANGTTQRFDSSEIAVQAGRATGQASCSLGGRAHTIALASVL